MDMFSSEEEKEKERRARELNRMGIVKKKNWLKHNSNSVFLWALLAWGEDRVNAQDVRERFGF